MRLVISFIAGLVFSAGLVVSGMANPAKVVNFLDFSGSWDPSLAFVMIGAIAVASIGFRLVGENSKPFSAPRFDLPNRKDIDRPLISGAIFFGVGWGLSGYCPGPALVSLVLSSQAMLSLFPMMLLGMWIAKKTA